VEDNLVNSSTGGTSGMRIYNPKEGTIVSGNIFHGNTSSGTNSLGGGLEIDADYTYLSQDTVTILVENNYFTDNEAANGGGFYTYDNPVILQNNVFKGNHASNRGGGMYLWNSSKPVPHLAVLINNSFSGNKSDMQGGAITSRISKPVIFNSIFWKDSTNTTNGTEIYLSIQDTVEIAYSDIDLDLIYGYVRDGGGNINQDPMFVNLETLLTDHNSPCVDAGTSRYTCNDGLTFDAPDYDILGNPRPQGEGYDMGAYDMDYWPVGIREIKDYGLRITNHPNPFTESTTFSYTLKDSSPVILQIYNSFGQLVAEPLNTTKSKGEYQLKWYATNLSAGMYYYRIQAASQVGSGKMVKY
jgi:hypothetical protein